MSSTHGVSENDTDAVAEQNEKKFNYFQKLWQYRKYLVIEPYVFFSYMASVFNAVAIQNFPLDKACRVNLGYNKIVCETMLDKGDIKCDGLLFENTTFGATADVLDLSLSSQGFNYTVCKAVVEAEKLTSDVSGKRAPIAAIFPLIIFLFAGSWSDRYNIRKPCLIAPVFGEGLSFVCLLISAVFFEELPMEFGSYCEYIVPSIFGGSTFCLMVVYSYITIATPEDDRVFRLGIFAMFISAIPFMGQPISGFLFQTLGYVLSFASALVFEIIAMLYVIFFINEVKPASKKEDAIVPPPLPQHAPLGLHYGSENLAYEGTNLDDLHVNKNLGFEVRQQHKSSKEDLMPLSKGFFRDFFDPTLVLDLIRFPMIKRKNNGRLLLIFLIGAYFLTIGPASAESEYWYRFGIVRLNWNGNDYSFFTTFSTASDLMGTFIGTAVLSKILKLSDSAIGILSAAAIVISRFLYAFSKDNISFYIAGVVEMGTSLRVIAIQTIGSSIVDGEELSKMFSIFGITDPIAQFIFPPIYSAIYQSTVGFFPGAIFLFGQIFFVPNMVAFIFCYFILLHNRNKAKTFEGEENGIRSGHANGDTEVTCL